MTELDKKSLSERDRCTKLITPAVRNAGLHELSQICEQVHFTKGENHCPRRTGYLWQGQVRPIAVEREMTVLCDKLEAQLTTTQTERRRLLEVVLHEALISNLIEP